MIKKFRTWLIALPFLFILSPMMVDGAFGLILGVRKKSDNVLDILVPILATLLFGYKIECMK